MKKIVLINKEDGSVAILRTADECSDELLARDIARVEGYVSHKEITEDEIPADRTFRNAWIQKDDKIDHCLEKCQALIREARNKELEKLDALAYAAERKNDQEEKDLINAEAQRLRDITKTDNFKVNDVEKLKECLADCKADTAKKPKNGAAELPNIPTAEAVAKHEPIMVDVGTEGEKVPLVKKSKKKS